MKCIRETRINVRRLFEVPLSNNRNFKDQRASLILLHPPISAIYPSLYRSCQTLHVTFSSSEAYRTISQKYSNLMFNSACEYRYFLWLRIYSDIHVTFILLKNTVLPFLFFLFFHTRGKFKSDLSAFQSIYISLNLYTSRSLSTKLSRIETKNILQV